MNTKFTPGPWEVHDYAEKLPAFVVHRRFDDKVKPETHSGYGSYLGIHVCDIPHQIGRPLEVSAFRRSVSSRVGHSILLLSALGAVSRLGLTPHREAVLLAGVLGHVEQQRLAGLRRLGLMHRRGVGAVVLGVVVLLVGCHDRNRRD